jgi:hypothetical protein
MQLDIGEVRFLTKVAQKSPRGLRLLLFKEKSTGKEKLVFIVKTASEDIDKLALSKMTWQVEQSKHAPRIVIVRLLILPEGSNEFFQSETGLLMNEEKDRNSLGALARQKSIEIFFFNYEAEFHSKIELLTTYNMGMTANALLELNPMIDEGKLIVKSENLSENDIKNAITGKVKDAKLKDKDLMDSIQKKMPVVSSSIPKAKPEEITKTSIKSNDMAVSGSYGTPTAKKPEKKEINADDLKKVNPSPAKLTPEDLMKSIPPGKIPASEVAKQAPPPVKKEEEDVFAALLNSQPAAGKSSLSTEDLLKFVDVKNDEPAAASLPSTLTSEELLKSLSENQATSDSLDSVDLFQSLSYGQNTISVDAGLSADDLFKSISSPGEEGDEISGLDKNNLLDIFKDSEEVYFIDNTPTSELVGAMTQELKRDELLEALMSEPTPLKVEEEEAKNTPPPPPTKQQEEVKSSVSITTPMDEDKKEDTSAISEEDLLKILNGEM